MNPASALSRLKDDELCIVTTEAGECEARWSVAARSFIRLERGVPVIVDHDTVEEWRPASIKF